MFLSSYMCLLHAMFDFMNIVALQGNQKAIIEVFLKTAIPIYKKQVEQPSTANYMKKKW